MKSNFTEIEIARNEGFARFHQAVPEEAIELERADRIYRASQHPVIGEHIMNGILDGEVEKEELVDRLLLHTDLSEEQVRILVDDISYEAREIVDYGDEA